MQRIANLLRRALGKQTPAPDHVQVSGSIIPSPDRRWCGPEFKDDNFYLTSAEREARRLIDHFHCTPDSTVLDVGCGQGRLPIGILRTIGRVNYLGLDVDRQSVEWCKEHIQGEHPSFRFEYLDVYNERYNKSGRKLDERFHFGIDTSSVDIIYLFSVFSHTTEQEMRTYLREFQRVLRDDGRVFFTTFVEVRVPNVSINPENYRLKCAGPLHVVRYDKAFLFGLLDECGYIVDEFSHGTEADGQSAVYLSKKLARTT
jgi:SAM-dependent methyltransferase